MTEVELIQRLGLSTVNAGYSEEQVEASSGPDPHKAPGSISRSTLASINPATGKPIARVTWATQEDYDRTVERAVQAFREWRSVPPPVRGELVRRIGQALRDQ